MNSTTAFKLLVSEAPLSSDEKAEMMLLIRELMRVNKVREDTIISCGVEFYTLKQDIANINRDYTAQFKRNGELAREIRNLEQANFDLRASVKRWHRLAEIEGKAELEDEITKLKHQIILMRSCYNCKYRHRENCINCEFNEDWEWEGP